LLQIKSALHLADSMAVLYCREPRMDRREMLKIAAAMGFALPVAHAAAAELRLGLPPPKLDGGMPLMNALKNRHSSREFSRKALPPQVLSNLLWAAFGVNRPGSGGRTAPSAHGSEEIEIYAAMENGLFRYDHKTHELQGIKAADLRRHTGRQEFVATAPLNLIYVADLGRMGGGGMDDKLMYSAADTGFISQNVYLCCAEEGLVTVVRGWIDRSALGRAMGLGPDQRIVLAQTVGYPA
jgi:SagB-type dehydrogenase family enzyme